MILHGDFHPFQVDDDDVFQRCTINTIILFIIYGVVQCVVFSAVVIIDYNGLENVHVLVVILSVVLLLHHFFVHVAMQDHENKLFLFGMKQTLKSG